MSPGPLSWVCPGGFLSVRPPRCLRCYSGPLVDCVTTITPAMPHHCDIFDARLRFGCGGCRPPLLDGGAGPQGAAVGRALWGLPPRVGSNELLATRCAGVFRTQLPKSVYTPSERGSRWR